MIMGWDFAGGLTRFFKSLMVQKRVIFALLMREALTRYGRHNIGLFWLFAEPMMFTLGVTALWSATGRGHASQLPIAAFALTGYSSVLLWRNMPGRCIGAIQPNASLMYHRNVRIIDIFMSRLILEAMGATGSFLVLTLAFNYVGLIDLPEDVFKIIIGWTLLAWFGAALAITLGTLAEHSELVDKLWHPASYLMFPLSGAGFLMSAAPPAFQKVVGWIPMVHCTEYIREGYFGSKIVAIHNLGYVLLVNLILTAFGLLQIRVIARRGVLSD